MIKFKGLYKIAYVALAAVLVCSFTASSDENSADEYVDPFLTSEFAVNQMTSLPLYHELLFNMDKDAYSGMYLDDNGNLVICAIDENEVNASINEAFDALEERLGRARTKAYKEVQSSEVEAQVFNLDANEVIETDDLGKIIDEDLLEVAVEYDGYSVVTDPTKYSVNEMNTIKEIIAENMSELGVYSVYEDVYENEVVVETSNSGLSVGAISEKLDEAKAEAVSQQAAVLSSADTASTASAASAAEAEEIAEKIAVLNDIDNLDCVRIEYTEEPNEIVPTSSVYLASGGEIKNRTMFLNKLYDSQDFEEYASCSMGMAVKLNGEVGWLTAAHCGEIGDVFHTVSCDTLTMGALRKKADNEEETNAIVDVGFIKKDVSSNVAPVKTIIGGGEWTDDNYHGMLGYAPVGGQVSVHSWKLPPNYRSSGKVTSIDSVIKYKDKKNYYVSSVNCYSLQGASGGPVVISGIINGKKYAYITGFVSGSNDNLAYPNTTFTDVATAVKYLGGNCFGYSID